MKSTYTITVPIPPACLSPNARVHHMARYRASLKVKDSTYIHAKAAFGRDRLDSWTSAIVQYDLYGRTSRGRDGDNALAQFKYCADGIAAAMNTNDKHFTYPPVRFHVDRDNPRLEITIMKGNE